MEIVDYGPLWETMRRNNVTQYQLLQSGIDNHTLDSLKKGGNITMLTLEKLCKIIGCTPNDIVYLSNSGCWRLNWWPLFLYKKRTRQTAIQLSARLKLSCCPNQCLCFQQKRCQYTVIFSLYPPLGH